MADETDDIERSASDAPSGLGESGSRPAVEAPGEESPDLPDADAEMPTPSEADASGPSAEAKPAPAPADARRPRSAQKGDPRRRPPGAAGAPPAGARRKRPKPVDPQAAERAARTKAAKSVARGKRRAGCLRGCAIMLAGILAIAVVISVAVWWEFFRPTRAVESGQPMQIEVLKGQGTIEIANQLAAAGIVANPNMFRLQLRLDDADDDLRPGVYDLHTGMDYVAVIDQLRLGPPIEYVTLTIPEGYTLAQIAKRVEAKTGIPAKQFELAAKTGHGHFSYRFLESNPTKSLEGYLFPKTYRVREGATAEDIVDIMLKQFELETRGIDYSYAESLGLKQHDVITIASMIEREAKVQRDRPLVSSVIYNRLIKGMKLEIDATVQYILGNKPRLLYRDLRVDSPYNTYLYEGLPPGPIASPGIAAIRAAASPKKTKYYFYVLTHRDGTHSFAETESEFDRLKAQSKRGLR